MAETAANHSAGALSSPGNVINGDQRPWDHSVYDKHDLGGSFQLKSRASQESTSTYPNFSHKRTVSYNLNGSIRSRTANDVDEVADPYGQEPTNLSMLKTKDPADRIPKHRSDSDDEDPERSHWIHRDKLAKIEDEEMQQYGKHIQGSIRSGHAPENRREDSGEHIETRAESPIFHQDIKQRVTSPAPIDDGFYDEEDRPAVFEDPRLPEEIAADPYETGPSRVYHMPCLRKSSSRIPIFASSPHPVPTEYRDGYSPRTRGNTINSADEEGLTVMKTRRPSNSTPRALQTPEPPQATQSAQHSDSSPPKTKSNKPSGSRKPSADIRKTSGTHKKSSPTSTNGSSSSQRPGTRAGERRPGTAINRPEGDPPWLATMYKPDPRLPPEQQMLPTHAKKLQQELWEKEGKIPSTYDKNFAPLAIRTDEMCLPPLPPPPPEDPTPVAPTPPSPAKSPALGARPGTSGTDHRGYKTMPTVHPSPPAPVFKPTMSTKPPPAPLQVEPPPKEKGCNCCIIM